ncbi:tRNA (mnm(5)s(2)U34)-methyltransferase [Effusibacillus pohliae]|uniref:tRNA (mnm(5)s(2)U34)-methyltransferase n=1 Tax=Effusibacillus pohliae TaxID=232270 RepID=UPI00037452DC|nr:class I SAM-dependent methyltransferase [Effusibacillus pohliae]
MSGWRIPSVLQQAKILLSERLSAGSIAVDATVGNGYDTLFLAECVGETGHVYGFDIQKQALTSAEARLSEAGLLSRVTFFHTGHERWVELLPPDLRRQIQAVTFNLGYLPGGDKAVVTRPETTLQALQAAFDWLAPGGIITAVLYSGHPGGKQEAERVLAWAGGLDQKQAQVLWYQFLNQKNQPPTLLAVSRHS